MVVFDDAVDTEDENGTGFCKVYAMMLSGYIGLLKSP